MFYSPSWLLWCLSWLFSPATHSQVPPALANRSCVPVEHSQDPVNHSHVCSHVNCHHVHSQVPVDCSCVCSQVPVNHPDASPNCYNLDEADEDNNTSNNSKTKVHAAQNLKSHGEAKPFHLGYYASTWVDVLITAHNNYRKYIHTKILSQIATQSASIRCIIFHWRLLQSLRMMAVNSMTVSLIFHPFPKFMKSVMMW